MIFSTYTTKQMSYFEDIIIDLKKKKHAVEYKISAAIAIDIKSELILQREKIKDAIYWLSAIEKLELEKVKIEKSIKIPPIGYCDIRLVLDPESDDPKMWSPYKINNEDVLLNSGDIILQMKI